MSSLCEHPMQPSWLSRASYGSLYMLFDAKIVQDKHNRK